MKRKMNIMDPDIIGSMAAIKRAARNAQKLAEATGTPLYVWKDGKVVDINPVRQTRKVRGRKP
jgi:hypothetical protein